MIHRYHALRSDRRLPLAPRISIAVFDHPTLFLRTFSRRQTQCFITFSHH